MQNAVEAWKQNLQTKVTELQDLLLRYMTTKEDAIGNELDGRLAGLKMMFANDRIPQPLTSLEYSLQQFRRNKNHAPSFRSLIKDYDTLPSVAQFSEIEPPSFDQIFEAYKADEELSSLVNELTEMLKRILAEADDTLSAQIARELQIILDQIKKRDRRSLYELQSWIDLASRALLLLIETQTGTKGLTIAYEAVKLTLKIKTRLLQHYVDAQKTLIEEYKLKYVEQAVAKIPEIQSEAEVQKYLEAHKPPSDKQAD